MRVGSNRDFCGMWFLLGEARSRALLFYSSMLKTLFITRRFPFSSIGIAKEIVHGQFSADHFLDALEAGGVQLHQA